MVLAARDHRLVAGTTLAKLDPLDEAELMQEIDRAIDARDADVVPRLSEPVGDLLCGEAARLPAQEVDHGLSRSSGAMTGLSQSVPRGALPLGGGGVGHPRTLAH
jgi:hypothetical protein